MEMFRKLVFWVVYYYYLVTSCIQEWLGIKDGIESFERFNRLSNGHSWIYLPKNSAERIDNVYLLLEDGTEINIDQPRHIPYPFSAKELGGVCYRCYDLCGDIALETANALN